MSAIGFFAREALKTLIRPWLAKSAQELGLVPNPPGSSVAGQLATLEGKLGNRLNEIENKIDNLKDHLDHDRLARLAGGLALLRKATRSQLKMGFLSDAAARLHEIAELPKYGSTDGRPNRELKALAHLGLAHCHKLADDSDDLISEHLGLVVQLDSNIANEAFGKNAISTRIWLLTWEQGKPFHEHIDGALGPAMLVIPSGSFIMGSPADELERNNWEPSPTQVSIEQPFAIGRYPVTFTEWDEFHKKSGYTHYPEAPFGRGNMPVVNVSWRDAKAYCDWLIKKTGAPYRLSSSQEWEYACRSGTTTPFHFGSKLSDRNANVVFEGPYVEDKSITRQRTVEVHNFEPNSFGLYQMHGNTFEWCETDSSDGKRKINRGGSWNTPPKTCRSAAYYADDADMRSKIIGFRLARTI